MPLSPLLRPRPRRHYHFLRTQRPVKSRSGSDPCSCPNDILFASRCLWCARWPFPSRRLSPALIKTPLQPFRKSRNGPGSAFHFTKDDLKFLNEAKAIDSALEAKGFILHDPDVQSFVDSVGQRVSAGRPTPEKVTFRFFVLRDTSVNAYSLANGSVYVTTGLLSLLKNEAQLASVLSHETSHVYERHGYLENRSAGQKSLAMEIIAAAAYWVPGGYAASLWPTPRPMSALILIESIYGYSREKEQQADADGIAAMAAAGYSPHAIPSSLTRTATSNSSSGRRSTTITPSSRIASQPHLKMPTATRPQMLELVPSRTT